MLPRPARPDNERSAAGRLFDLLLAGVGGDDVFEMRCQRDGRLSIACRAVPGKITARAQRGQVREKSVGIIGPKRLVTVGVAGEVIFVFEAHL